MSREKTPKPGCRRRQASAEGNTGWIARTRDLNRPGAVEEQRMHANNSVRENREISWSLAAEGQTSREGKAKAAIPR